MIIQSPALGEWQGRGPGSQALNHMAFLHGKELNNLVGERTDIHQGQWVGCGHIASRHIEWFASRARPNATLSHPSTIAEREPEDDRLGGDRILS
jgi:hypothetical protein